MTYVDEVMDVLNKQRLNRWAKQTGFCKRRGTLLAYDFIALMVVGQLGMKHPSLGAMVTAIQAGISRQALHYRFSKDAADLLLKCLQFVLKQKTRQIEGIDIGLFKPFARVLLIDSSSWDVHPALHDCLPGSGGSASEANCKLQTLYDYKSGDLSFLDVTAGTVPDNRYTDHLPGLLQKRDLALFDQGYFKVLTLADITHKEAFFLTRFYVGTSLKDAHTEEPIDLEKLLSRVKDNVCEMDVLMGGKKVAPFTSRLICLRVNEQISNERRRRLKKEARKKGRTVSKRHLTLCDWTLLVTHVPREWLPVDMARALYALRWQIELLFKQLKSILCVHVSNTKNKYRLLCELYGKLIGAVIIHRIHAAQNIKWWHSKRREVSMDKLYKRFQERAFTLLRLLLSSLSEAIAYLLDQIKLIIPGCLKAFQRSRLSTLETLEVEWDPLLEIQGPASSFGAA